MSYPSTIGDAKNGFRPCIVINDGTSRCFVLPKKFRGKKGEERAYECALTVYGLLQRSIEEFLRKRKFEEQ